MPNQTSQYDTFMSFFLAARHIKQDQLQSPYIVMGLKCGQLYYPSPRII